MRKPCPVIGNFHRLVNYLIMVQFAKKKWSPDARTPFYMQCALTRDQFRGTLENLPLFRSQVTRSLKLVSPLRL